MFSFAEDLPCVVVVDGDFCSSFFVTETREVTFVDRVEVPSGFETNSSVPVEPVEVSPLPRTFQPELSDPRESFPD